MHILITADTVGGVWTYARELVSGLARRGVRITLVSFGNIPAPQQTQWMEGLPNLDYRPTAFKLEWMQDSADDLAASADYLESVVREVRPDLLHLNQFYYGRLRCDVPRIVVAHSDVVSWWVAVHQQEPPDSSWMRWYRETVARGIAQATAVVAPSGWMLKQVSRYHGRIERWSVIHNGRSPAFFNPHLTKDDLIVTVGRLWDRGKNASLLLQREMPAPVCIVGSDQHPESRGNAFPEKKASAGVQFAPQQDERELSRLFARASIYVATSCYEPFGLAPVEAALSRCAIVASDIPPLRELWEGAAIFFRSNDSASLHEKLEQLVKNRELRRTHGNLAYSHARQKFSANRMVDEYINFYKALVPAAALAA
jgi:glycosyltransferase involved in cell wall biosynthesis